MTNEEINSTDVRDVLTKAREKIADPDRWVKKVFKRYRKRNGKSLTCYCLDGAILNTRAQPLNVMYAENAVEDVIKEKAVGFHSHPHDNIIRFNDCPDTTHEEVLDVLDTAIAKCAKEA